MLLELDNVPKLHNVLASLFTWILLAGYIVFPATFNRLQEDSGLDEKANTELKEQALKTARCVQCIFISPFPFWLPSLVRSFVLVFVRAQPIKQLEQSEADLSADALLPGTSRYCTWRPLRAGSAS